MRTARFENLNTGTIEVVTTDSYDPNLHEGHLICADPDCHGRVHFRAESVDMGHSFGRRAHFAAHSQEEHIAGCSAISEPDADAGQAVSLHQALAEGRHIIINLNMDCGSPDIRGMFAVAASRQTRREAIQNLDTPYMRHLRDNSYKALSVKSTAEFIKVIHRIVKAGGTNALHQVYVGHQQQIMSLAEMSFAGDDSQQIALYKEFDKPFADKKEPDTALSFPRLFLFKPTKRTRSGHAVGASPKGSAKNMGKIGDIALILLNDMDVVDKDEQIDKMLRDAPQEGVWVIATPRYSASQAAQTYRQAKGRSSAVMPEFEVASQDAAYAYLKWRVLGTHQIASAQEFPDVPCAPKGVQLDLFGQNPNILKSQGPS